MYMGIYRPKGMDLCHQILIKLSKRMPKRVDKVRGNKRTAGMDEKRGLLCHKLCVKEWLREVQAWSSNFD